MKARWIVVGVVAALMGCNQMHMGKDKEKEGDEVKMSLNDVPAPARETLMKEAGGAEIKTVDKEMKDGKTIYETDVMMGGKNWELKVDPDGKLISKKLDEESGEKDKKKEKEEDEGKEKK